MKEKTGAFRIVTDTYVTDDSGTGVVHQAAYFGQVRQFVFLLMTFSTLWQQIME